MELDEEEKTGSGPSRQNALSSSCSTFLRIDLQGVEGVERSAGKKKPPKLQGPARGTSAAWVVFEHAWGLVETRTRVLDKGVQLPFAGGLPFSALPQPDEMGCGSDQASRSQFFDFPGD